MVDGRGKCQKRGGEGEWRGKEKDENNENISFCIVYLDWGLD